MDIREIEAQAKALAPVIAAAVAKAVAPLLAALEQDATTIAALNKRIDDLPAPVEPNLEALAKAAASMVILPTIDLALLASEAAALVQVPQPESVNLQSLAEDAARLVPQPIIDMKAIAALVEVPEPVPGKDAEPVDLEALAKAAAALVEVPEPVPGKDAEPVDLEALAKAAAALVEVPEPVPGKDAEPVDLAAVAALVPVPEVDLAAVAALVQVPVSEVVDLESLARAAAALVPAPVVPAAENGRDAADLEILPGIDESKQYPRGSYATHRGGLWKSYERTHGMRGWECIVEGLESVTVTQESIRKFAVTLVKSSGVESVEHFDMPVPIYKGVWREQDSYEAHDNVTWAGSQWASTKVDNTDKPGTGDSWVLTVKAGRAGKDLRENASQFDPTKGVKLP